MSIRSIDLNLNTPLIYTANDTRNGLVGRIRLNVNVSLQNDGNLFSNTLTTVNVQGILNFHMEGEKETYFKYLLCLPQKFYYLFRS